MLFPLERQVVCASFCSGLLGGREWSGGWGSGRLCGRSRGLSLGVAVDGPGVDAVKPAAIIFMCVDIERDGYFLTALDIELLDAVLAKYTEATLAWILVVSLDNIFL